MTTLLLVALGAAVGAPVRYLTDRAVQARQGSGLPWGTLVVNVVGSLLFGVLVAGADAGAVPPAVLVAAGAGFCGALTTFSTFGYQTVELAGARTRPTAVGNVLLHLGAGLGAAWLGLAVTASVLG